MVEPFDLLHRRVEGGRGVRVGLGIGLQARQLQLAACDRDRCAQLVAGVVEEDALVLQRVLDAFEQVVEPASELGELLSGILGHRQAPAELSRRAGRDHVGVLDHLLHGAQRGAGQEPAGDGHQHRQQREADGERQLQSVLGPGRLLERRADHDHLVAVTHRAGPQPGPLAAGPGVAHEGDLVEAGACELAAAEDRRGGAARAVTRPRPPRRHRSPARRTRRRGCWDWTVDPVDVLLICCAAARKRVWSVSSSAEFNADRYCTSTSTPTSADSTTVTSAKHEGEPAAKRARAKPHGSRRAAQPVSHSADGLDRPPPERAVDLLPEIAHVHVDDVRRAVVGEVPRVLEDRGAA